VTGTGFDITAPLSTFEFWGVDTAGDTVGPFPAPPGTVTALSTTNVTVPVPPQVYNTQGTWWLRISNTRDPINRGGWSELSVTTLQVGPGNNPQCDQQDFGDFGYLDSLRQVPGGNGTVGGNKALSWNIADGLDHGVEAYPTGAPPTVGAPSSTSSDNDCYEMGSAPYSSAILDDDPYRDDANCVNIYNGNKQQEVKEGLVVGGTVNPGGFTFDGRLTGLPASVPAGCASATANLFGKTIDNNVLSCYVTSGNTLADVTKNNPSEVLDGSIVDSPRFFFIPVIYSRFSPDNGYYPILEFKAAFVTSEGWTGGSFPTSQNGLVLSGNGNSIDALQVQVFELNALPEWVASTEAGIPYLGSGPKLVRLIA
jgi:hypothetical protein